MLGAQHGPSRSFFSQPVKCFYLSKLSGFILTGCILIGHTILGSRRLCGVDELCRHALAMTLIILADALREAVLMNIFQPGIGLLPG